MKSWERLRRIMPPIVNMRRTKQWASVCLLLSGLVVGGSAHAQFSVDAGCAEDQAGIDLGCAAKEVLFSENSVNIIDGCDFPGDTATVELQVNIELNAQTRYDIGLYLATDGDPNGDGALTGQCRINTLPEPIEDEDGDFCGDLTAATTPQVISTGEITFGCFDDDGDGTLDVPTCTSWEVGNGGDVCSSANDAFAGTPSKCNCESLAISVPVPGQIIVNKVTDPGGDPTSFDFQLSGDGVNQEFQLADGGSFDTATAGVRIDPGLYVVSESAVPGWSTAVTCDDGSEASPISIAPGETVTCTFTNTQVDPAAIGLEKSGPTDPVTAAGQEIDYTFTITNEGGATLFNVTLDDTSLDEPALCLASILAVGESTTCTGTYTVTQADIDAGVPIVNTATASSDETGDAIDTHTVPVEGTEILAIDKTGDAGPAVVNQLIQYGIEVTNDGTVTLNNVTVTDDLIPSLDCTPTLPVTSLAPGEAIQCTGSYRVTLADVDSGGPIVNTAEATSDQTEPVTDDHQVAVQQDASLQVFKSGNPGPVGVGDPIAYVISVVNTGLSSALNVNVTDDLIPSLDCTPTLPVASLAPGDTIECTGSYVATEADAINGSVINTATATSDNTSPDEDSHEAVVTGTSILSIEKDGQSEPAAVGDLISYDIIVVNDGTVTLTNVNVQDPLISLDCAPAVPLQSLAPGGSIECEGFYTVTLEDVDAGVPIVNRATATSAQTDPVFDEHEVPVVQDAALEIVKTGDTGPVDVGDTINYTITVQNTGQSSAFDVNVTDDLITSLSCNPTVPVASLAPSAQILCTGSYVATETDGNNGMVVNTAGVTSSNAPSDEANHVVDVNPPVVEPQACRTNFWQDPGSFTQYCSTYTPDTLFDDAFGGDGFPGLTLLDVMRQGGGGLNALGRNIAASLLNACSDDVNFEYTEQEVIDAYLAVYDGSAAEIKAVKNEFKTANEAPCPLDLVTGPVAELSIDKTGDAGPVVANELINYMIVVENTGDLNLTNVVVSDPMLTDLSCNPMAGSDLAVGEIISCTGSYVVSEDEADAGGNIVNIASVDSDQTDPVSDDHVVPIDGPVGSGGEGCSHTQWIGLQAQWCGGGITPTTAFADVFDDAFGTLTLLEVLQQSGGGLNALGRQTVAALLNACSASVSYDLAEGTVIDSFNNVFPGSSSEYKILKDEFKVLNLQGCPFD